MRKWKPIHASPNRPISIPAIRNNTVEVAIIGAGIAGIAVAYYLSVRLGCRSVVLIDARQPMSYTSAQSGDNYRNWWPHETMTSFTDDSIDELDRLCTETDNVFSMTRGGYALSSKDKDVSDIVAAIPGAIDVDVYDRQADVQRRFPSLASDTRNVIHIRRGGDLNGQQLGQHFLQAFQAAGGKRVNGKLTGIVNGPPYQLDIETRGEITSIAAEKLVVAAGPFVNDVVAMLGRELPIKNIYQQKIAFEDSHGAIPRDMPFSIDLDSKTLGWTDEEIEMLRQDDELARLAGEMPPGTHCRPEGGERSRWVKLGWAYNTRHSDPCEDMASEPAIDASFPEIVIRGAATMIPALAGYVQRPPTRMHHYGGYYTMTDENWPLIGPLDNSGAFVIGALSGFGSMAAAAAGKLCAAHVCGAQLPTYADDLSLKRLENSKLLAELAATSNKGLL